MNRIVLFAILSRKSEALKRGRSHCEGCHRIVSYAKLGRPCPNLHAQFFASQPHCSPLYSGYD